MNSESGVALWDSFKQGNWFAYTSLYNDHFRALSNYGYKFTRDTNLIEDAIHDLFVRLWTTRDNLSTPASVRNYLYKSLRNILLRKMKTQGKFTGIDTAEYPCGFEVTYNNHFLSAIEDRELQSRIKNVINTLPPRQREIIFLRFYEGLSYEEIADIMGIGINSTYKLLYKALHNLQQTLGSSSLLSLLLSLKSFNHFFSA
jgi:RNA polymerase sigma factor (sigma-70 family)